MLTFIAGLRDRAAASTARRSAVTLMFVVVGASALAACGSDDKKSGGGKQVDVKLTDAGCDPAKFDLKSGSTTFNVANGGTSKVNEFEIFDGPRVLGEKEGLTDGKSGSFTVTLQPGNYTTSCPGGTTAGTGTLKVGGAAATASDDPQLAAATSSYASYVTDQTKTLEKKTAAFVAAVKAGNVAKAKSLFADTRSNYETIEPVAESFGDLDPEIDARVNDVAKGDKWTGFHRIEKGLWVDKSTKGLDPIAAKLLVDVKKLGVKTKDLKYKPEELANGANGLLDEVSASKITGEEDRYSHTDLSDFEANVSGSETAFGLLAPALRKKDPELTKTIETNFKAVQAELAKLKQGGEYPSYDTIDKATRRKLSQQVDALAEPLSKVAAKLQ